MGHFHDYKNDPALYGRGHDLTSRLRAESKSMQLSQWRGIGGLRLADTNSLELCLNYNGEAEHHMDSAENHHRS